MISFLSGQTKSYFMRSEYPLWYRSNYNLVIFSLVKSENVKNIFFLPSSHIIYNLSFFLNHFIFLNIKTQPKKKTNTIKAFIEHYRSLGADHIILYFTSKISDHPKMVEFIYSIWETGEPGILHTHLCK